MEQLNQDDMAVIMEASMLRMKPDHIVNMNRMLFTAKRDRPRCAAQSLIAVAREDDLIAWLLRESSIPSFLKQSAAERAALDSIAPTEKTTER